jgi:hypothetical protein
VRLPSSYSSLSIEAVIRRGGPVVIRFRFNIFTAPLLIFVSVMIPANASGQEYYRDIRPVLVENCLACHNSEGPGWSMEDAEETFQRRHILAAMVLGGMMPPWIAEAGHQEYLSDPSLGPAILDLVKDWRDGGFARGEPVDDPVPNDEAVHGAAAHAFQPDLSLDVLPGGTYLPNQTRTDDYRCFVVDWTGEEPLYVTGFRAAPGNLLVAHHVVVHAVTPAMASRFRELEEEEEGSGYQCFGGALPDRLGQRAEREAYEARYPDGVRELSRNNFWLAHWAPGMDGHRFAEDTGILLDPGSVLVVQMHYYGAVAPGEQDAGSRVEFQVAESVERPAFHLAQTRNAWLAGERNGSMVIPAGETATYEVSNDLEGMVPYISHVTQLEEERIRGLEVHSVNLHMHAFGHSGVVSLTDRQGRKETLLSIPRWDLRWQRDFTFAEPKVFARDELRGASLAVECTFRNTTRETVYGGYGSFDEMCFNFAYIAVQVEDVAADGETGEAGAR